MNSSKKYGVHLITPKAIAIQTLKHLNINEATIRDMETRI